MAGDVEDVIAVSRKRLVYRFRAAHFQDSYVAFHRSDGVEDAVQLVFIVQQVIPRFAFIGAADGYQDTQWTGNLGLAFLCNVGIFIYWTPEKADVWMQTERSGISSTGNAHRLPWQIGVPSL